MLRDITLGQYYPADSVVHKLDPRVKLFATMIYIIALFTFRGILGICDHNRYAYFYDQNFKSTVFVYRKRVKSHCGAAFDYGSV